MTGFQATTPVDCSPISTPSIISSNRDVLEGHRVSPGCGKSVLTEAEAKQVGAWIVDKMPIVARNTRRFSKSMIFAVSNRGQMRFMFYDEALTADRVCRHSVAVD